MRWKEKLRKLKEEAKSKKVEQKLEHQILAEKVTEDIEECLFVLEEFSSITNSEIKFIDNRHMEKDEQTGKKYFAGGITLIVERRKRLSEKIFRLPEKRSRIIALVKFPHPKAIRKMEGYEDSVKFVYSDIARKLPLSQFNSQWLKDNLEEAYQYFLNQQ
ncbi:MAG: hypothetical protein MUO85_04325 [candidate division Zixibacteria bacterium]|nr:hypothetical protein [candidate division Zixibacteria bacterium]